METNFTKDDMKWFVLYVEEKYVDYFTANTWDGNKIGNLKRGEYLSVGKDGQQHKLTLEQILDIYTPIKDEYRLNPYNFDQQK